jgi:mannose-6-phosphate isomerase-like protein (cupin superfamily)
MHTRRDEISGYITKDGSTIRELMHPAQNKNVNQSLAEATIPAHTITALHMHKQTEEIYYILSGCGEMTLGNEVFSVESGDSICIRPNTPHQIRNTGTTELKFLCACSPAYSHEDTYLLT